MSFGDKHIAITGGTGYIGRHVRHYFVSRDIPFKTIGRRTFYCESSDISNWQTSEQLAEELKLFDVFALLNISGYFVSNHQPSDLPNLLEANLNNNVYLYEACKLARIDRIVSIGTSWEGRANDGERARNLYAELKAASYRILRWYAAEYGFRSIHLLLNDTYGGDDERQKLMPYIKQSIMDGKPLHLHNRSGEINLLYIDDVIAGIDHALLMTETLEKGTVSRYRLFGDIAIGIQNLIYEVEKVVGHNIPHEFKDDLQVVDRILAAGESHLPGWEPQTSLSDGLRLYFGTLDES